MGEPSGQASSASSKRKGYWILPKTCNCGRLHNHHGAVAFCQWWDMMCCDIYRRNYCIWICPILLRFSWRRRGYWIPPKTCNSGRLHNHHRQTGWSPRGFDHPLPLARALSLFLTREVTIDLLVIEAGTRQPCLSSVQQHTHNLTAARCVKWLQFLRFTTIFNLFLSRCKPQWKNG